MQMDKWGLSRSSPTETVRTPAISCSLLPSRSGRKATGNLNKKRACRWISGVTAAARPRKPSARRRISCSVFPSRSGRKATGNFSPRCPLCRGEQRETQNRGTVPGPSLEARSRNFLGRPKFLRAFPLGQVGENRSKNLEVKPQGLKPPLRVCSSRCGS